MLSGLVVETPGQSTLDTTCATERTGVFRFTCDIPSHRPSMWGQLVVLPPGGMEGDGR